MSKLYVWCTSVFAVLFLLAGGCSTYGTFEADELACDVTMAEPAATMESVVDKSAVNEAATTGNIERTVNAPERLLTYDINMTIVVQNISAALDSLKTMTATLKGYMQSMEANTITLRVPSARLNEAFDLIGKLGEITSRSIKGTDVTEEMMDLDIRLRTMEETRNRLAELLKKSDKVEELLKVEKEMQRVVGELELIKGRIKYLSHAVAYSTITVALNSSVAQTELREVMPFPWVRKLGADVVVSPGASFLPPRNWRSWLKMELPETFVKLAERNGSTRAMSGTGVMVLVSRHENFQNGSMDFWSQIIRRWLVANQVIALSEVKEFTLNTGAKGTQFIGTKTIGRKEYAYRLVAVTDDDDIYTVECWGIKDEVEKVKDFLDQAVKTLKVKPQ
jgi:Domain of unknown function (DUF4349)